MIICICYFTTRLCLNHNSHESVLKQVRMFLSILPWKEQVATEIGKQNLVIFSGNVCEDKM